VLRADLRAGHGVPRRRSAGRLTADRGATATRHVSGYTEGGCGARDLPLRTISNFPRGRARSAGTTSSTGATRSTRASARGAFSFLAGRRTGQRAPPRAVTRTRCMRAATRSRARSGWSATRRRARRSCSASDGARAGRSRASSSATASICARSEARSRACGPKASRGGGPAAPVAARMARGRRGGRGVL